MSSFSYTCNLLINFSNYFVSEQHVCVQYRDLSLSSSSPSTMAFRSFTISTSLAISSSSRLRSLSVFKWSTEQIMCLHYAHHDITVKWINSSQMNNNRNKYLVSPAVFWALLQHWAAPPLDLESWHWSQHKHTNHLRKQDVSHQIQESSILTCTPAQTLVSCRPACFWWDWTSPPLNHSSMCPLLHLKTGKT